MDSVGGNEGLCSYIFFFLSAYLEDGLKEELNEYEKKRERNKI